MTVNTRCCLHQTSQIGRPGGEDRTRESVRTPFRQVTFWLVEKEHEGTQKDERASGYIIKSSNVTSTKLIHLRFKTASAKVVVLIHLCKLVHDSCADHRQLRLKFVTGKPFYGENDPNCRPPMCGEISKLI